MKRKKIGWITAGALLVLAIVMSIRIGSSRYTWQEFVGGLFRREGYEKVTFVLYSLRLPRTASAMLAGVGLSISGVALQNITGNDLAGPNIIGVNAGAGFLVIGCMFFRPDWIRFLPAFAFLGAFMTSVIILLIGNTITGKGSAMILAGVAVTALLNAGISLISLLDTDVLSGYTDFSVGGLSGNGFDALLIPLVMIIGSVLVMLVFSEDVDAIMLGGEIAQAVGVNVRVIQLAVILASSAAAGAVVSFAGLLGFVGLMVPHIAKRLFGVRTKMAVLGSSLTGAIIVLFADMVGRTLLPGTEIPAGIVMAFIGVPFFVYLMIRRRAA